MTAYQGLKGDSITGGGAYVTKHGFGELDRLLKLSHGASPSDAPSPAASAVSRTDDALIDHDARAVTVCAELYIRAVAEESSATARGTRYFRVPILMRLALHKLYREASAGTSPI